MASSGTYTRKVSGRTPTTDIPVSEGIEMNDMILAAHLDAFVGEFGLDHLPESESFEHFVNYCVVSKHYPDSFEPEGVFVKRIVVLPQLV